MNNANLIVEKNANKAKKEDSQTNEKHTMEQSVKLSISNEGLLSKSHTAERAGNL